MCCSTWLTDFRKVTTASARYQQLSLNPLKLAGQCGKLKCCLNFELDTYLDALNHFPKQEKILKTENGDAEFVKMDIFKKFLWYTYKENRSKWYKLTLDQVLEIIDLNNNNELSISLEDYESDIEVLPSLDFENVVGQDSLARFDAPKRTKRRNRKNKSKKQAVGVNSSKKNKGQSTKGPSKRNNLKQPNIQKKNNQIKSPKQRVISSKSNGKTNQ